MDFRLDEKHDWLHEWFYGGPAPEKYRYEEMKIALASVQLHYPEWALSEMEKQARRAARKGGSKNAGVVDEETNRRIFIKSGKKEQMRDWIQSLVSRKHEIRQKCTPFERGFLNRMYLIFKKNKLERLTMKQYAKLLELSAKYLGRVK